MLKIELLDPSKITKDGRYCDMNIPLITKLSDDEIVQVRRYFHDSTIACDRKIQGKLVKTRNYELTRDSYSTKKVKVKGKINSNRKGMVKLVIFGMTVLLSIESFLVYKNIKTIPKPTITATQETDIDITKPLVATSVSETLAHFEEMKQETYRLIDKYCKIYSIDYGITCNIFENLTNSFTNPEFVNELYIKGIHCKGNEVRASSLEELVLYVVRNIKQAPSDFGLSSDNLTVYNIYENDGNYEQKISYYADLLGVDKCLVYAIVKEETGFDSDLFRNSNNPAGLRLNGDWWSFSTKDEGFIELCLEMKKYELLGATTIEQIGAIHAPISDGNAGWVANVTQIYDMAKENENELFGNTIPNGMSK